LPQAFREARQLARAGPAFLVLFGWFSVACGVPMAPTSTACLVLLHERGAALRTGPADTVPGTLVGATRRGREHGFVDVTCIGVVVTSFVIARRLVGFERFTRATLAAIVAAAGLVQLQSSFFFLFFPSLAS